MDVHGSMACTAVHLAAWKAFFELHIVASKHILHEGLAPLICLVEESRESRHVRCRISWNNPCTCTARLCGSLHSISSSAQRVNTNWPGEVRVMHVTYLHNFKKEIKSDKMRWEIHHHTSILHRYIHFWLQTELLQQSKRSRRVGMASWRKLTAHLAQRLLTSCCLVDIEKVLGCVCDVLWMGLVVRDLCLHGNGVRKLFMLRMFSNWKIDGLDIVEQ